MRICIFTHTFPRFPGDTPAPFMENLSCALANLGHDVFVLAPYDSKFQFNTPRPYKLKTYRYIIPDSLHVLGFSREFDSGKNLRLITYLLAPFMLFFGFLALVRLIKKEKIEVVSAHWIIPSGFIMALASLFTSTPYTVTIPGSDIYLGGKNILFKLMTSVAANRASYVLSDNSYFMDQLLSLGIKPKNRDIIVYGADAKKFTPEKKDEHILKKLNLDNKNPVILGVGRLVAKKGFIYLVKAMSSVLKKLPSAMLVIVGDGEQRKSLEAEIEKSSIYENVRLTGTVNYNQLSKYYNAADIFVMPSISDESGNIDASPVAMMEAMACGTPVIATKFSGSKKFVLEGETGYLVGQKNSRELSRAIVKLLNRNREKMKRNVRKIAVDNFSTDSVAKKYSSLFAKAIKKR